MKIVQNFKKCLTVPHRFTKVYSELERIGFRLFMDALASPEENKDFYRRLRTYQKNTAKVDKLHEKYCATRRKYTTLFG